MIRLRLLIAVALLVVATGCAFTDVPVTLPQAPAGMTSSGGRGRQVVVASPLSEAREISDRCGMQKNGYNMDTADAICQGDPAVWFPGVLADALRQAGFDVVDDPNAARDSALRLDGALVKLFVEPVIGFWSGSLEADLAVRLQATSRTGLQAERTFFVKGWKAGQMMSVTAAYDIALDRATKGTLEEMIRAILELMDRYPQLGDASSGDVPSIVLSLMISEDPS